MTLMPCDISQSRHRPSNVTSIVRRIAPEASVEADNTTLACHRPRAAANRVILSNARVALACLVNSNTSPHTGLSHAGVHNPQQFERASRIEVRQTRVRDRRNGSVCAYLQCEGTDRLETCRAGLARKRHFVM